MSRKIKRLLIATGNAGKLQEMREHLSGLPLEIMDLSAFPDAAAPEEIGSSFAENAAIKAAGYAVQTSEWAVADDSGLEIEALGGEPGVRSARFGGEGTDYAVKMGAILHRLEETDERSARFVTVITLADPEGEIVLTAEGVCEGVIAREPRGVNGFGYDPIFIPRGSEHTFGEMSDEEKRSVSHRARAAREFINKMRDFIGV